MAVQINTATFTGIEGIIVTVEIDISNGLPCFNIVGLADTSVKESKERVRAAIINSGFEFPIRRITINLAPADLRKEGSLFDLPIAIGILIATGQVYLNDLDDYLFMGELSLLGELKKIKGALPIIIEASEQNIRKFIVPTSNAKECGLIKEANIYALDNLKQVVDFLQYKDLRPYVDKESNEYSQYPFDFEEVMGQESAKRAIEVAAAGGHNILMHGAPGSGKTMLAQRIPSILPSLSYEEALEVTKIYSVSGNLDKSGALIYERPFRNPHHTASRIALVGGGNKLMPGEISLAHNGVLFLDEILEFKKSVLEVLRQPLEDRVMRITRSTGNVNYPANFMLVGSLNPCPCGYSGTNTRQCTCSEYEKKIYLSRLSGPLLDRIDIFTSVNPLSYNEINVKQHNEKSSDIKARVEIARKIQKARYESEGIYCNAQINQKLINKYCKLDSKANKILQNVYDKFHLSTRAYSRILKVARTIADLEERQKVTENDLIEAIQYRKFIDNNIIM